MGILKPIFYIFVGQRLAGDEKINIVKRTWRLLTSFNESNIITTYD